MTLDPKGACIVVTGATGALGSQLVPDLAARGYRVAALARPGSSAALSALSANTERVTPFEIDVSSGAAWQAVVERIIRELGAPVGAVLTAGGYQGGKRLVDAGANASWRAMLQMNLESAHGALQALLVPMLAEKRGSIVLLGSRAAVRPWESANAAAYAVSKAAVVALAQAAAAEVLNDGVRVNAVLPSTIDTPQNRVFMPKADPTRWVSPTSLCDVIAFLLSEAARDVSGAALPVYGRA